MDIKRIWLLADTHFGYQADDRIWLDDYVGYFEDVVVPYMRKEVREGDILIHCGDVFDNRTSIGLETMNRVISLFEEFSKIFSDVRITVGNHDAARKSTNFVTSVNILKYIPNIKIYYEPRIEYIGGKKCLLNPWVEDLEKQRTALQGVDVDYVFGHLQVGGSKAVSRGGSRIDMTSGLSLSDFKKAQVYAGHIHIKQDMKNVHYLGNPYHKDRGDFGEVKGIHILNLETGKLEFIENKVSPRYMKESVYDILDLTIGELKERWKNNRVDLHMSGDDYNKCKSYFDDFRESLNNCFRELETIGDGKVEDNEITSTLKFGDAKSGDDLLNDFIDQHDLEPDFKKKVLQKIEDFKIRL